LVKIALKKIGE